MRFLLLAVAVCLLLPTAKGQESTPPPPPSGLAKTLFSEHSLPRIRLRGHFEFFSTREESETLVLTSSADFAGEIDLATRTTRFDLRNYGSPVSGTTELAQHALYSVTFDGEQWATVDSGSKIAPLPAGLAAVATITTGHPRLFLKSLDHLCFPLFAPLLNAQTGWTQLPLRQVLTDGVPGGKITTRRDAGLLTLTVAKDDITDEYTFDPARACVLTRRRTEFGGDITPVRRASSQIINEVVVKEFTQVGDRWFPRSAELTQTVNGQLQVRRTYQIEEVSIATDTKPIEIVIPPHTEVRSEEDGASFRTGDTPTPMPPKR